MRGSIWAMALCVAPVMAGAMEVTLGAPWDGKTVPPGQQCRLDGGKGATPPLTVKGLPKGTAMVVLSFDDQDYPPLSTRGGHGQIGFPVTGPSASLPAVPGMAARLPGGAKVVAKARGTGEYASPGYLPPCSGGKGHRYTVEVIAVGADGQRLQAVKLGLGRY